MTNPQPKPTIAIKKSMTLIEALEYERFQGKKDWVDVKTNKKVIIGNASYNPRQ